MSMWSPSGSKKISASLPLLLIALGVLIALLNSAFSPLPQECEQKYVVHRRETAEEIAQKLLIDLNVLLDINEITLDDRLSFGDVLCIPQVGKAGQPVLALSSSLSATHTHYTLSLDAFGLGSSADYVVRLLTNAAPLEWFIYGQVESNSDGAVKDDFAIPGRLQGAENITICLLNKLSEASACTISKKVAVYDVFVPLPNIASTDEFIVTYDNGRLTVTATDLISDHAYYVRVRSTGSSVDVRVGTLIVDGKGEGTKTFRLPSEFDSGGILEVCLKNVYNDEVECVLLSVDEGR